MNDLDKQLAELALINKAELLPNPKLDGQGMKVGPAVPPKPEKQQPLIPQSYPLKKNVEPSYSSRIQSNQFYSNLPPNNHSHYSNTATLNSSNKLNLHNSNYANLPRTIDDQAEYSRSVSALSNNSLPRSSVSYGTGYATKNTSSVSTLNSTPKPYDGNKSDVAYSNIQIQPSRNRDGLIYSNLAHPSSDRAVYSNLPQDGVTYSNGDDFPPPPPPLDLSSGLGDYAPCTVNTNLPPPPDDLLPPPSPVSSSYSELRRATQPGSDFHNYSMGSQVSSTYESIYEPINPRPPSQMSSRSNYSIYAPYSGPSSTHTGPSQSVSRIGHNKEQEVDSLTDMLVQGMVGANPEIEEDVYGICVRCGEKIVGENSGCTAMDQLYHIKCFTCHQCARNLQGKPFYALDGHPYCQADYLNTLEKCCVCQEPILHRILRATGKPYHPGCFCCVVCGKSLDGIPFTVDATNRVHCIEDFHKIFAPRCWVCKQPIMPEAGKEETVRVVALDHSFHIQCYKCEDCDLVLSSEAEGRGCYPLDGHVLCKSCNARRVQTLTRHMTTEL
ncbi:thyroid receptor-interacting protein 6-like [Sitophilus oryzae]|uniref:Thyroid receptor-interacting protein 6-like n=1 Tax=Sitophilus oryzae TaxID=7048 RepID=A0A6J2X8E6_SITOR|nr:thyroid receptor-interacting protein 6-like [Sitophilus oryzae]XP_030747504.1 thyroid receptor-interacting protein 6-like [Sitophilus oryzae]